MKLLKFLSMISLLVHPLHADLFESGLEPWGVDASLVHPKKPIAKKTHLMQKACMHSIRFFQNYISDIDGPRSTFYPTSSEYARMMIQEHGVLKGITLGCDRLMRENNDPWVYRTIKKHGVLRKLDN